MNTSPKSHVRLQRANSQRRESKEIRRRERVIQISTNEESAIRLIGALLSKFHEKWSPGKKVLEMTECHKWTKPQESFKNAPTLAIVD
ncbi:MAG: transposase [Leptospirillum sp.]|jgi:transposase-like protein